MDLIRLPELARITRRDGEGTARLPVHIKSVLLKLFTN